MCGGSRPFVQVGSKSRPSSGDGPRRSTALLRVTVGASGLVISPRAWTVLASLRCLELRPLGLPWEHLGDSRQFVTETVPDETERSLVQRVSTCSMGVLRIGAPMPSGDEIRDAQRASWAGLSAGWEKWDSVIMDQLGPVSASMIESLDIADDQLHLDIAAGTGEPGLTVAKLAPNGHIVLTDLSAEMLDIATRRAHAQGITNFETKVCSAEDLPFGDATFDSISVRFGYMFLPDVAQATAEFARVLKPGGRLCSSVWASPENNPWTTIAMEAIAAEIDLAPPDPDGPNMFRCAVPGYVSALYEAAALQHVAEWDVEVELVTRSPAEYWEMISEHVSLAVAALQQVDEPARHRIAQAVLANAGRYQVDNNFRVPGLARCIIGTK